MFSWLENRFSQQTKQKKPLSKIRLNLLVQDEEDEEYTGFEDITEPTIVPENSNKIKVTSKYLTKYEKTRILGARALQISLGSPPTVDIGTTTDSYEIAMLELQQKKIPIIIRRYLPNNTFEDWHISELELLD